MAPLEALEASAGLLADIDTGGDSGGGERPAVVVVLGDKRPVSDQRENGVCGDDASPDTVVGRVTVDS